MSMTGLYDPAFEHDGCGVAMVARPDGARTHEAVARGLASLCNLEHRGAEGADADTGDGAGILLQMPDRFLRAVLDFELPAAGQYGVAVCFLPKESSRRSELERMFSERAERRGLSVLGWRDVPVRGDTVGRVARDAAPVIRQLFLAGPPGGTTDQLELDLYIARR